MTYTAGERVVLQRVAVESIETGLRTGTPLAVGAREYPESLHHQRSSFVTLNRSDALRGCIGSLDPRTSLIEDVACNAFAAAFRDPRFPPLQTAELDTLTIEISVLGPKEPVKFESESDLLEILRPGVDGLVLQDGQFRGTFLPSVWKSLPQPEDFLRHLKMKAGLPAGYWSDTLTVWRYTTESFSAAVAGIRSDLGRQQNDKYQKYQQQ